MKGFPCGSGVKNPPANAGDVGLIPGSGRAPGEGNGKHSSTLAWEISWTEEPGRLQTMGPQKSQTQLSNKKDGLMLFAATWTDLEIVMLSEVRRRKRHVVQNCLYVESKMKR